MVSSNEAMHNAPQMGTVATADNVVFVQLEHAGCTLPCVYSSMQCQQQAHQHCMNCAAHSCRAVSIGSDVPARTSACS
jgi:hypothetical protein